MKKTSAGLLPYYKNGNEIMVLLAHPGGPFYKNKDIGYWSVVKGEVELNEDLFNTAKREFLEETGLELKGPFVDLGYIIQKSGKTVYAWAFEMEYDMSAGFISNMIELAWPPKSNKLIQIPEIDQLVYFAFEEALEKINVAQKELLHRLIAGINVLA